MGGYIRKIFWGSPVRKVFSVLTGLFFLPAWVFNFENWLAVNGYDKLLTDSESPLLKGLGGLATFLLSSEPRWFLAGAIFALVAEGIWRFKISRVEIVTDRSRASTKESGSDWALGLTDISAKQSACAFAGISEDQYKYSSKAKAIYNQIKVAFDSGLVLSSSTLESRTTRFGDAKIILRFPPGRNVEKQICSYGTLLPVSELCRHFKDMPWDHSWIVKPSSFRPESLPSIEPETQP